MSVKSAIIDQPETFEFSTENLAWAEDQINKYPEGRQASAVIPLLWRAQEQHEGWLPQPAIDYVAEMLDMAPIRVMEVATFYTMFAMQPVGKFFVQLCGTTPCMLRGSDALVEVLKKRVGEQRQVSSDGLFSWLEVECLGACSNAPMVQINQDYFEDLTAEKFEALLDDLEAGRTVTPGPQNGRSCSCPDGGATSLTDASLYAAEADAQGQPVAALEADALANFGKNSSQASLEAAKPAAEAAEPVLADLTPDDQKFVLSDDFKPEGLTAPRGGKSDDLKQISGIGPKLEETLNGLGIFHYDQIAGWSRETIAWVDDFLSFKGRIDRDDWVGQANILAAALLLNQQAGDKGGED